MGGGTVQEICRSWRGWDCRQLPADRAVVLCFQGMPPESTFSTALDTGQAEVLFCCQGGLRLELLPLRKLELRSGQVLFLPGRAGRCCCRFFPERFQGILVSGKEEDLQASLTALCPGLPAAPPDRQHGCGVVPAALWSKSLLHVLDQLPEHMQGDYCYLKVVELLYLLHAGPSFTACLGEANYYDPYQIQTVEKIHDELMEHLDERLTIPQLAERYRISSTMLKVCFRQMYGVPLHQYLLTRRMERAAELLSHTDQTVLQVAAAVGYSSASQFGVAFKAQYQITPAQYRRAAKMSVSDSSSPKQSEKTSPNPL